MKSEAGGREDVLRGLEGMTPGPYRVVKTAYGNCIGAALGPAGGKTLYIQSPTGGGFQEVNAEGFARVAALVKEVKAMRVALRSIHSLPPDYTNPEDYVRDVRAIARALLPEPPEAPNG